MRRPPPPAALRLADSGRGPQPADPVESYRRLAEVFHAVLSEQSLDALLDQVARTLAELVPYDTLTIYRADEARRVLVPLASRRDRWAEAVLSQEIPYGIGITGWAAERREPVLSNRAHLDPRADTVAGTPAGEPEALISVPLVARGGLAGALNIYRLGEDAVFGEDEFELAKRFGDAAALALDNAETRARLEHQAQTDSLTGLYNHRTFHERLRSELARANRAGDSVALLMADIDDFKRVNDVHGHAAGDQLLAALADLLRSSVRASDVVCRIGGEEIAVIMASCNAGDALGLARRLRDALASLELGPAGTISLSMGVAQGPEHAANPRELVACAEAAMMTAKAKGKNRIVVFDDRGAIRPGSPRNGGRDVRSIAQLKLLQSLAGKLSRLNDVREIGSAIADELLVLTDFQLCRVTVVDGRDLVPIASRGDGEELPGKVGEGIAGLAAETRAAQRLDAEAESAVAVPLCYGSRVIGVIEIARLGAGQFDDDDVRLLELLAGHASVALENARLYEAQRREAESSGALLECAERLSQAMSCEEIAAAAVETAARLTGAAQSALWLEDPILRDYVCAASIGYEEGFAELVRKRLRREPAERLVLSRETPFVLDASDGRQLFPFDSARSAVRTAAVAPLCAADGVRGWIAVPDGSSGRGHGFTDDHLRRLAGLSYQASGALLKARLHREQEELAEVADALLELGRELAGAEGVDAVLDRVAALTARIFGSPRTAVWLQVEPGGESGPLAVHGYDGEERAAYLRIRFSPEQAAAYLDRSEPFVLQAAERRLAWSLPDDGRAVAIAPFAVSERRLGCIAAAAPEPGEYHFPAARLRLLAGIANHTRLALRLAGR